MLKLVGTFPLFGILFFYCATPNPTKIQNTRDTLIRLVPSNDLPQLIIQTKEIMQQLGIKIRPNVDLDDTIKVVTTDTLPSRTMAMFQRKHALYPLNMIGVIDQRFYETPIILKSLVLDTLINMGFEKGQMNYIIGVSGMIHEITHYLQLTYGKGTIVDTSSSTRIERIRNYVKQPVEFEANAVQGYYYLYYKNRAILDVIMASKLTSRKKSEFIINSFYTLWYRQDLEVFE